MQIDINEIFRRGVELVSLSIIPILFLSPSLNVGYLSSSFKFYDGCSLRKLRSDVDANYILPSNVIFKMVVSYLIAISSLSILSKYFINLPFKQVLVVRN